MGNLQDSKLKDFTFVQQVAHRQLGNVRILEYKGYQVFEAKLNSANEELLQKRKELQHKNLVKLLHINTNGNPMMCTEMQQITVVGEYFAQTLNERTSKILSTGFDESRLWQIIYQIVDGCAYLNEKDHLFGRDGYSETDSKEMRGMQKEHDFLPGYPDAYNKAFVSDEFYHMCQEQLDDLRNAKPMQSDPLKSDVFTCGLLILELASQQCSSAYYNWQQKRIDIEKVNQTIENLPFLGYSTVLQRLIQQMTSTERPSFVVIRDGLKKIESDIMEGKPFYGSHVKQSQQVKCVGFETFGK